MISNALPSKLFLIFHFLELIGENIITCVFSIRYHKLAEMYVPIDVMGFMFGKFIVQVNVNPSEDLCLKLDVSR